MPSRRADSLASSRRRLASAPPPSVWCPASPLVTETNLTRWPIWANKAAVPAARMSQSSGWAPNAMTRILLSWASMSPAQAKGNSRSLPMAQDYTVGSVDVLEPVGAARLELVSFDGDSRVRLVGSYQASHSHELQRKRVIELRRPTDRQFHAFPLRQRRLSGEQYATT